MKRRSVTALVLVLVMMASVFGLAGCGKKSDGGTEKTTKAPVTEAADDEKEQKGSEIVEPETMIGEYVHYNINLGIGDAASVDDDWIVFYQDESTGVTYLIAAECIAEKNCPAFAAAFSRGGYQHTFSYNKELNVDYSLTFSNYDPYNAAVIDQGVRDRYMHDWVLKKQGDTHKHAFIASLMDQTVWGDFILKGADGNKLDASIMAIASPTLNLFEKSWEASGYTPITYKIGDVTGEKADAYEGYLFDKSSSDSKANIELKTLDKSGYWVSEDYTQTKIDKVYFTSPAEAPDCMGYWLLGPGAGPSHSNVALVVFKDGRIEYISFDNNNCSIRPVVSLNTSLIGKDSSSEIYYLGKNING